MSNEQNQKEKPNVKKAIEILSGYKNSYFGDSLHGGEIGVVDIIELLKNKETVVRCKDCKWYSHEISLCNNLMSPKEQTFFCADGERS